MEPNGDDLLEGNLEDFLNSHPEPQADPLAGQMDPPTTTNVTVSTDQPQTLRTAAPTQPITPMTATGLPMPADKSMRPGIGWYRTLNHLRQEQLPQEARYEPSVGWHVLCSPPPPTPMDFQMPTPAHGTFGVVPTAPTRRPTPTPTGLQVPAALDGTFDAFPAAPTLQPAPRGKGKNKRKAGHITNATIQGPAKKPRRESVQGQLQTLALESVSLADIKASTSMKCRCAFTKEAKKNAIPRVPNSFLLFRADFAAKAKNGTVQSTLSGSASAAWKALPQGEKAKYERQFNDLRAQQEIDHPDYHLVPGRAARLDFGTAECRCGAFAANTELLRINQGIIIGAPGAPATALGAGVGGTAEAPAQPYGGTQYGGAQDDNTPYGAPQYGAQQYGQNPVVVPQQQPHQGDVHMGNTPELDSAEFQVSDAQADATMRNLLGQDPDVPMPTMEPTSPHIGQSLYNGPPSANTRARSLSFDAESFLRDQTEGFGMMIEEEEGPGSAEEGPAARTRSKSLSPQIDWVAEEEDLYGLSPPE